MRDFKKLSKRQQGILRFMEAYLAGKGFPPTIREIGEATGINSTSVVNYNLNKLVQAGYLERTERMSRAMRLVRSVPESGSTRSIPSSGMKMAESMRVPMVGQIYASEPVPVPEDAGYYPDEDSMIEVTPSMLGGVDLEEVYALRVKGDSMIDAMVREGDIILLRKQTTARDGDMVAVWLTERNETTLKTFYNEGSRIRLQPAHPTMQPIYVSSSAIEVQGRVLSIIRQVS